MECTRYISNIQMAGGKIVYVPMSPPADGASKTSSAGNWTLDFAQLEKAISPKTKMIVLNTPRKFGAGKVIAERCILIVL
jgi:kynurenine aminotransferase